MDIRTITQGWNFMRILRLLLGGAILVKGIMASDTVATILGLAFAGMAIANIGCCGSGGCAINTPRTKQKIKDTDYEKVVTNK